MDFKERKVKILDSSWKIIFKSVEEEQSLSEYDGYTDKTSKVIVVRKDEIDSNVDNNEYRVKETMRHEIIHAFLFESGLAFNWQHPDEFGHDETTIDWFAIQWHKINKVFEELEI